MLLLPRASTKTVPFSANVKASQQNTPKDSKVAFLKVPMQLTNYMCGPGCHISLPVFEAEKHALCIYLKGILKRFLSH